jgi:hypothetical protein
MRNSVPMLAAMLAACGCSGPPDPASDPIPAGARAVAYAPASEVIDGGHSNVYAQVGKDPQDLIPVRVGTMVLVVEDPATPGRGRKVLVKVLDGDHADRLAQVAREHLRPAPR